MSSSKQIPRSRTKLFQQISAFPLISKINDNNNNDDDTLLARPLPLRLTLFECPSAFVRDFSALFPDVESFRQKRPFSLLLFAFATANNMSGWNQDVEVERERLHRVFLRLGEDVASKLSGAVFWADLVDPVGGKPHRGSYCNDNLFETDPRLRPFGVKIEDLGCCKCVRVEEFGSKAFVGCVFADAPFDHEAWNDVLWLGLMINRRGRKTIEWSIPFYKLVIMELLLLILLFVTRRCFLIIDDYSSLVHDIRYLCSWFLLLLSAAAVNAVSLFILMWSVEMGT